MDYLIIINLLFYYYCIIFIHYLLQMQSSGIAGEGSTFFISITATPAPHLPDSPSTVLSTNNWLTLSTVIVIVEPCKVASEVNFSIIIIILNSFHFTERFTYLLL